MENVRRKFLEEYLEHVSYEIIGTISAFSRMIKINQSSVNYHWSRQSEINDSLDLMATHFRSLHEFFCDSPKKGYVRASDYTKSFTPIRNNPLLKKANNQTMHLTKERHRISTDETTKQWSPNEVIKWLVINLENWEKGLDAGYKKILAEYLEPISSFILWYKWKANITE